ncbi:MAG: PIN domain-containing protein [Methanolinea sp.]|nr:MAG: PIN domain-containing protein [Methanolinea sp.]
MHSLQEIPPDTRAIFDTNILVYWVTDHPRYGKLCTECVKRVEKGEIQGVIPATILNELLHRIMIAETVEKGYACTSQDAVRVLKEDPAIIRHLTIAGNVYDSLPTIGFEMIENERGISGLMYHFSKELCLMAKDAAIVAYAHTFTLAHIVTNERDFQRVKWLTCWGP